MTKFKEEKEFLEKEKMVKTLPNIKLPDSFKYSDNMEDAIKDSRLIVIAVPAGAVNDVSKELSKY